jgi:hypothetical protein
MKINFIIIYLLNFFFVQNNQDSIIKWKKDNKLKWIDYEAILKKETPVAAVSSVGIYSAFISINNEKSLIEIYAGFDKKKSAVWNVKANDNILTHEQGHFDLVELYSRKMRKYLSNNQYKIDFYNYEIELDKLFNLYDDSLKNMQDQYDWETHFSLELEKQIMWTKTIKSELKNLDIYSNTFVTIYFKKE